METRWECVNCGHLFDLPDTNKPDNCICKSPKFKLLAITFNQVEEKMIEKDIFDHNSPRSQRDTKRVLALTCAMTYLHQLQREVKEYNGRKI